MHINEILAFTARVYDRNLVILFIKKKIAYRLQANKNERNTQNVDFLCYKSSKKCCHLLFFKKKSQIRFYCEKERNQMLFEANFISLMNDNVTLSTHMK